jgi:toxin ParE1/3/4
VSDVVWSKTALDDADEIAAYIAADNPVAARKVLDKIETTAERLGRRAIGRIGRVAGTYEKSVIGVPYIIAYAVTRARTGAEQIVILRVIHSARDWAKNQWPK